LHFRSQTRLTQPQTSQTSVNENPQGLTPGNFRRVIAASVLWGACVLTGFAVLGAEQFTPVPASTLVTDFPRDSKLVLATDKPTLVLFLHPHCPCSRATLSELERLQVQTQDKIAVTIVFTIPPGTPAGWEKGDLLDRAHAISHAQVCLDANGAAARRFGVNGSGHTLLYAPTGQLLFSGGITAARGEEGDNPGETAVADFVLHGRADLTRTPVFGCQLL
jgi:hypothetical protein